METEALKLQIDLVVYIKERKTVNNTNIFLDIIRKTIDILNFQIDVSYDSF